MTERPRTAYLILGLVRRGFRTGYDVKRFVDAGARFFWATSYGQLYPELKRLQDQGLLDAQDSVSGRKRVAYSLTEVGEVELEEWLDSEAEMLFELRSEALMKLVLAAAPEQQLAIVRRMRQQAEATRAAIAAVDPPQPIGHQIREYGLAVQGATVAWCEQVERWLLAAGSR